MVAGDGRPSWSVCPVGLLQMSAKTLAGFADIDRYASELHASAGPGFTDLCVTAVRPDEQHVHRRWSGHACVYKDRPPTKLFRPTTEP